jgi:uncharacterized phage protein (TIGR02218 family)
MARFVTGAMQTHLNQPLTTLAKLFQVTRRDAVVINLTDHDESITFNSALYLPVSGLTASNITFTSDFSASNFEVTGVIEPDVVDYNDLFSGAYDFSFVTTSLVNWTDLTMMAIALHQGWCGKVDILNNAFKMEIVSLTQALAQKYGRYYGPLCDADFCDARCKLNIADWTSTGAVVVGINNNGNFTSNLTQPNNYFNDGIVLWTSGNNAGRRQQVNSYSHSEGAVSLSIPCFYPIQIGDVFTIIRGCDHSPLTCANTYGNIVNFRGFDNVPGPDYIHVPNQKYFGTSS